MREEPRREQSAFAFDRKDEAKGASETGRAEDEPHALAVPASALSTRRDPDEDLAADTAPLEPGRALAPADFTAPRTGPLDAALRWAYRVGISPALLASPLRKPAKPRLLATVESPLAGDRGAGMALRAGHFLVNGVRAPIAQMDFGPAARLTPPFARMVHGFGWLRDLSACSPREHCVPVAERVLAAWLDANPLSLIHI